MKKLLVALLLGFTITATAQKGTISVKGTDGVTYTVYTKYGQDTANARLSEKIKSDSIVHARRISTLESTVSKHVSSISVLQSQSTNYATSIKAHDSIIAKLNAGKVTIDFNYFELTPTGLKPKPIDLSAYDSSLLNLSQRIDKIDVDKLKQVFDWLPAAKSSFLNLSK